MGGWVFEVVGLGKLAIAGADRAGDLEHGGMIAAERLGMGAHFGCELLQPDAAVTRAQELALRLIEPGPEREAFAFREEVAGLVGRPNRRALEEQALDLRGRSIAERERRGEAGGECKG